MESQEEMDKFLEMYNLPTLNQQEIESMERPVNPSCPGFLFWGEL